LATDRGKRFHHQGGIVYFLIALAAILALPWILRRGEDSSLVPDHIPLRATAKGEIPVEKY
jgi:hypothetical protein